MSDAGKTPDQRTWLLALGRNSEFFEEFHKQSKIGSVCSMNPMRILNNIKHKRAF